MIFSRSLFNVFKYLFSIFLTYVMFTWLQGQTITQMIAAKNINILTVTASFLTVTALWYIICRSKIHGFRLFILILILIGLFLPVTEILLKSAVNSNIEDTVRNYLSKTSILKGFVYAAYPLPIFIFAAGWRKKNFRQSFYYISHIGFFSYLFRFILSFMIFPLTMSLISLFSPAKIISLSFIINPSFILAMGIQNSIALIFFFILLKTGRGSQGERILMFSLIMSALMLFHAESGNNWIIVVAAAQFLSFLSSGPVLLTYRRKNY